MSHHPTFFGRNLDQALWRACEALGKTPAQLTYETSQTPEGMVRVVVTSEPLVEGDAPRPEPLPPAPEAARAKTPTARRHTLSAADVPALPADADVAEFVRQVLTEILSRMGVAAPQSVTVAADGVQVAIEATAADVLYAAGDARVLEALQYIINRAVQHWSRGAAPTVFIDVAGRRRRRADSLISLSERLSGGAVRLKSGLWIDAVSAADRRVIHQALAGRADVETRSEGEGGLRRLRVGAR